MEFDETFLKTFYQSNHNIYQKTGKIGDRGHEHKSGHFYVVNTNPDIQKGTNIRTWGTHAQIRTLGQGDTCTSKSLVTWGTHAQIQTKDKRDTCTDSDKGTGGHMHRFGHPDIRGHMHIWRQKHI